MQRLGSKASCPRAHTARTGVFPQLSPCCLVPPPTRPVPLPCMHAITLQVMEDRHLASRQAGPSGQGLGSRKAPKGDGDAAGQDGGSDGSGSSGDEGSSSGSDSDGQDSDSSVSEDPELDPGTGALVGDDEGQAAGNGKGGKSRRKAGAPPAALNNSLLSMYAKGGGAGEVEGAKRAGEPAAFAPPDVVAAAAARAIAAAKALQAGKGGGAGVSSAAAGPGTSSQQQQQQGGGSVLRTVSGKPSLVLEETPGKDKDRADTGAAAVGRAGATPAVSASVVTGAGAGTGTGAGTRQDGEAQGGRLAPSVVGDGAEGAGLAGVREGAEAQAGGQSDADGARSNKRGRPSDAAGLRDRCGTGALAEGQLRTGLASATYLTTCEGCLDWKRGGGGTGRGRRLHCTTNQ